MDAGGRGEHAGRIFGWEHVSATVSQILALTDPIDAVGWERIVAATQEVKDMYPLQWAVYRLHVIHVSTGDQWRGRGGNPTPIKLKCVSTCSRGIAANAIWTIS